ncbi:MAG: hypothetical protein ACUVSZ_10555, partial [Chloroflexus sp.]|uniref:hypothetical protein n=1 Tax=Chloroflexus sp. TaxID=1904827 RepID=UPI0040499847
AGGGRMPSPLTTPPTEAEQGLEGEGREEGNTPTPARPRWGRAYALTPHHSPDRSGAGAGG